MKRQMINCKTLVAAPVVIGLTFSSIPLLGSVAHTKTVDIPVPKAAVAAAFNVALSSTKIHLNSFGSKNGTSWHKNSSYVQLPGGSKKAFPISEYTFDITKYRKLRYYVGDMNTSSIQATINNSSIEATAQFESQGEEIKAKCIRRLLGKWNECSLDMERDIHLNNSILSVSLTPVAYNGSISYANPKVDFKTDLNIPNKLCQAFSGICSKIEGRIKGELTKTIEDQLTNGLNNPNVKKKVAEAVKTAPSISKYVEAKAKITKITAQGNNFVVTVELPN
ncbi:hypothetical protein [Coleofasciculus sp. FACHB-129]|uniref:hypothetical protein n=1 Tax=Cyanophyceae TaxID=3028117 RepID=UPI0016867C74|nr:hypothetical protein [Coleofasciculus sp. FACHB-129]MBD1893148.1 hypothetical protein [Coleofasciculus sp. FACHB-129]